MPRTLSASSRDDHRLHLPPLRVRRRTLSSSPSKPASKSTSSKSKAGALVERLVAEGQTTDADILLTVDVGGLYLAQEAGVLQPIQSDLLETRIPDYLREPEGHWFGLDKRARVIVYNPEYVSADELSTYEALAAPEWRGRLLARSSSNIYNQSLLASIIASSDTPTAVKWASAVRKNMARPPQGNDRDQMRAVAAGLADAALVNTYYLGLLLAPRTLKTAPSPKSSDSSSRTKTTEAPTSTSAEPAS